MLYRNRDKFKKNALLPNLQDMDLRERLIFEILKNTHTCTICLVKIRSENPIWTCSKCFHMFHLKCVKNWAKKSLEDEDKNGSQLFWRCPTCQAHETLQPDEIEYLCFCRARKSPYFIPGVSRLPHSCENVCKKLRPKKTPTSIECFHPCTELCHPGPCPTCVMTIKVSCPCGKDVKTVRCGSEMAGPCGKVCELPLGQEKCQLGVHFCMELCHLNDCPPCKVLLKASCFCNENSKFFECGSKEVCNLDIIPFDLKTDEESGALILPSVYSCEKICLNTLPCNKHQCQRNCHEGPCGRCRQLPKFLLKCPCGNTPLRKLVSSGDIYGDRKDCTDPIPCCDNICSKTLRNCDHKCSKKCHEGPCPPCEEDIIIKCRCNKSVKHVKCNEYKEKEPFLCDRVCRKFMSCRRHKCKENCCDIEEHICTEICNRLLSCGRHNCEDLCHFGNCQSCWRGIIYDTITCHCGATSLEPPQPCGTLTECEKPCTREHVCFHPVKHTCHNDILCPPCTVLMAKPCPGGHTMLPNIPCFQNVLTCGMPCKKPLPDCDHFCDKRCHSGSCLTQNETCKQKCSKERFDCGHMCEAPCHVGVECSKVMKPCKASIKLCCQCGVRQEYMKCYKILENSELMMRRFQRMTLEQKEDDGSVTITMNSVKKENLPKNLPSYLKSSGNSILPCNSECDMAIKKQKEDKARSELCMSLWRREASNDKEFNELICPFPAPEYSSFLKTFGAKNMGFTKDIEAKIEELVLDARDPKKNGRAYHRFPPMNKNKRRFIKELSEFYGIEATSFDPEPNRHIMLTALRSLAQFPGLSNGTQNKLSNIITKEKLALIKPKEGGAVVGKEDTIILSNQDFPT